MSERPGLPRSRRRMRVRVGAESVTTAAYQVCVIDVGMFLADKIVYDKSVAAFYCNAQSSIAILKDLPNRNSNNRRELWGVARVIRSFWWFWTNRNILSCNNAISWSNHTLSSVSSAAPAVTADITFSKRPDLAADNKSDSGVLAKNLLKKPMIWNFHWSDRWCQIMFEMKIKRRYQKGSPRRAQVLQWLKLVSELNDLEL